MERVMFVVRKKVQELKIFLLDVLAARTRLTAIGTADMFVVKTYHNLRFNQNEK